MIVFALGAAAVVAAVLGSRTPGTGRASWLLVAVMLGVIGAISGAFIARGSRGARALAAAELRVTEGVLSQSSDMGGSWWGEVGDARFGLERYSEERLATGARYRVYWLPLDGHAWVQSIERVDETVAG